MSGLEKVLKKLEIIEERLALLTEEIEDIKKSNNKMDNHIDFIENIYNNIKTPFHYVLNRISNIMILDKSSNQNSLIQNT
tara:strand:- start:849 stop:1088 length:240 start_codon:yes stop_codon:yes gene_type:complete